MSRLRIWPESPRISLRSFNVLCSTLSGDVSITFGFRFPCSVKLDGSIFLASESFVFMIQANP